MQEKRKKRVVFGDLEGGKIPPQELDLEIAVLGALMIENDAFEKVQEILNPNSFYKDTHAKVFKAISEIHKAKEKCDILTVTAQLKKNGELEAVGGAFFVTQLTNRVAGTANLEYHARIVAEAYLAREVIRIGGEFSSRGYDSMEDVFDLIDELHKEVDALKNFGIDASGDVPMSVSIDERVKEKIEMIARGIKITGISTGNDALDKLISGFNNACVYVFAGSPSMGKSVKGLNYAKIAGLQNKRVAVFSLEMSKNDYIDRFISEESRIPLQDYRANRMTEYDIERMKKAGDTFKSLPINIYDNPSASPNYIRKKIKADIKKYGRVDMAVIDYAQLLKSDEKSGSREQEVSSSVKQIKVIAKEFNIPIILLAQVGRGIYQVNDRRPNLSHLRESAELENSADFVGFIYRPSHFYDRDKHPDFNDENSKIYSCDQYEYDLLSELIVEKNRAGKPNSVLYERFYGQFSCFSKDDIYAQETPFAEPDNSDIIPF
jgi:replicative DNA helicase